ncbi:MAG TPA: head GIN domain-containing protein [Chitinophagaceae bacterium]|jgi:hypothetical protein|nr:head GIN domain-containing protein [Chitinophagaceae bacterium]
MKKFLALVASGLFTLIVLAQDKIVYDAHAEKRSVSSFHAVRVSHGIDLLLSQGNEEALAISADEKELKEAVKTEVVDGELRIYIKQDLEKWWNQLRRKGRSVKAYVSFKNMDHLDASSGSRTTIDGSLNSKKLSVNLSSGAHLKGRVVGEDVKIDVSSGAVTDISGEVEDLQVNTSSGAHFYGFDLTASTCKADASSGSKIQLSVNKEIKASASSGGGINYKGDAAQTHVSTSSGGKVRKGG